MVSYQIDIASNMNFNFVFLGCRARLKFLLGGNINICGLIKQVEQVIEDIKTRPAATDVHVLPEISSHSGPPSS